MDIWEELKSERERRRLLEVGAARIPESRQEGGWLVAGPPLTPSPHQAQMNLKTEESLTPSSSPTQPQ